MSSNQTTGVPAYLPFQKQFAPYKWYKPLLATLVAFGFFIAFSAVLFLIGDLISDIIVCALYLAFIIFADKKLGWFNRIKKDDVSEFNAKIAAKKAKKAKSA